MSYTDKYQHLTEITPATVPWTDFYDPEQYKGEDDDRYTYTENCSRCGGQGGAEAWKFTGYTCYQCGGNNSTWTVETTVGDMRARAKKAAQYLAGQVRKDLKAARKAADKLAAYRASYPALAWFSWEGYRELGDAGALRGAADYALPDMLNQANGLTPKQAPFAAKLIQESLDRRQIAEARAAGWTSGTEAPEGEKITVEGIVLRTWQEDDTFSYYGGKVDKMLIRTDAGWEVETSVPKKWIEELGEADALRDRSVRFVSNLERARNKPGKAYTRKQKSKLALLDA